MGIINFLKMNQLNVILLNIFAMSLFLTPCNVYSYTVSKSLHIPLIIKNSTESTTIIPITHQARINHIKKNSITPRGEIPEITTSTISLNYPFMEINENENQKTQTYQEWEKSTKKSTNLQHKKAKKIHQKYENEKE